MDAPPRLAKYSGCGYHLRATLRSKWICVQSKRVCSGLLHRQRNGLPDRAFPRGLVLQPRAQSRVANFRLSVPEIGRQIAFNAEIAEQQFDRGHPLGEISTNVGNAHAQAKFMTTIVLRSDNHTLTSSRKNLRLVWGN